MSKRGVVILNKDAQKRLEEWKKEENNMFTKEIERVFKKYRKTFKDLTKYE